MGSAILKLLSEWSGSGACSETKVSSKCKREGPDAKIIVIKIPFIFPSSVNMAFNTLRLLIPTEPPDRKLSKIEILRLAGSYITHLDNQLYTGELEQPCLQKSETGIKNSSLCTFCWSSVKKDKSITPSMSNHYKMPY